MATPQELAQQIADRSAQAAALMADLDRRAREAATARLAPSGDTLAMYEDRFNEVYNPANAQAVGQANAMRDYATGLGDILVRKAREARKGKSNFNPYGDYQLPTLEQILALQGLKFGQPATPTRMMIGSADANERRILNATSPATTPTTRRYGSADAQERRLGF